MDCNKVLLLVLILSSVFAQVQQFLLVHNPGTLHVPIPYDKSEEDCVFRITVRLRRSLKL